MRVEDGLLVLTYVTQSDIKGWIPTSVVNYVTSTAAPELVKKMVNGALNYKNWLKETGKPEAYEMYGVEKEDQLGHDVIVYGEESRY